MTDSPTHPDAAEWYALQDEDTQHAFDERCAIRQAQSDMYAGFTADKRIRAIERMTLKEMKDEQARP